jgi:hypothetical protein
MLAVAALAMLTACAQGPVAPTPSAPADPWGLAWDVFLLARLAPLRLSEQQVQALLQVYQETGVLEGGAATVAQFSNLKNRLLQGQEVALGELRDVFTLLRSPFGAVAERNLNSAALDKLLAVLEDWQLVVLANAGWGAARWREARRPHPPSGAAEALVALRRIPEQEWAAQKRTIAKRFASAAPADQQQVEAGVADLLERIRQMSDDEIRRRVGELVQELEIFAPAQLDALSLLQPVDQTALRRQAAALFLDPRLPRLLQELAAARGWSISIPAGR